MAFQDIQLQVRMVFDLNKCVGCHTCSMACKTMWTDRDQGMMYMYWNNVETKPGRGYPLNWEQDAPAGGFAPDPVCDPNTPPAENQFGLHIPSIEGEYGTPWEYNYGDALNVTLNPLTATTAALPFDKTHLPQPKMVVPSPDPAGPAAYSSNWDEDRGEGLHPNAYFFYLPRICNHCTNPACLAACPRQAIYKREEDGIVLVDQTRCRGYRYCVKSCPYRKIYFNPVVKKSQKCIFCYPRLEKLDPGTGLDPLTGQPLGNFCASQCTGRIRWVSYYDPQRTPLDPSNLRYNANRLVDEFKVGLRLHPEYGTMPNTFYIPPMTPPRLNADGTVQVDASGKPVRRVPVDYLAKLFGDDHCQTHDERVARIEGIFDTLEAARAAAAAGRTSPLSDLLIARGDNDQIQLFK